MWRALGWSLAISLALFGVAEAQEALFTMPETARPVNRTRERVVDCAAHGAWMEPQGWTVRRTDGGDVIALEPRGRAILIRVQTRTRSTAIRNAADFERVARQVASQWAPDTHFAPIVEHPHSRWRIDRRLEGSATLHGTPLRVVAESRGERQLWVTLFPVDATTIAADVDTSMTSFLPLTSHACLCDYDCDPRAR
jgi:hypothetical protein